MTQGVIETGGPAVAESSIDTTAAPHGGAAVAGEHHASRAGLFTRLALTLVIFTVLAASILSRPPKPLDEFDQPFYLTVAHDLVHFGVFTNGFIDDDVAGKPTLKPGMFFAPLYPWLLAVVARLDPGFAHTVDCAAVAYRATRETPDCEINVWPVLLIHVLLLTLGAVAVAGAATVLFPRPGMFEVTAVIATAALLADAHQFSFLMTESVTFSFYSLAMLAVVSACARGQRWLFVMGGVGFGLLCLTRVSFLVAALIVPALIVLDARFRRRSSRGGALWFFVAFLVVMLPWAARNSVSVGKFGLTEEYGAVTLVERFGYNRMTPREFMLAFPYCLPEIGHPLVERIFGAGLMDRFQYDLPDSFYAIGREQRGALTAKYGRVDKVIGAVTWDEMRENWWRHILTSIPLAWCGMWVGGWLGLLLVPMFAAAAVAAWRQRARQLLLYSAPAVAMLGLHAVLASFYTRYNLALIGPFSIAAAWIVVSVSARLRAAHCGGREVARDDAQ
jgi:hypothetical protein